MAPKYSIMHPGSLIEPGKAWLGEPSHSPLQCCFPCVLKDPEHHSGCSIRRSYFWGPPQLQRPKEAGRPKRYGPQRSCAACQTALDAALATLAKSVQNCSDRQWPVDLDHQRVQCWYAKSVVTLKSNSNTWTSR